MPKLKSAIAGLAISTALTGGVVAVGAATTSFAAGAATQVSTGTSVVAGGCNGWWRCGWRRHHRQKTHVRVKVHNRNRNINRFPRPTPTPTITITATPAEDE
ncbi:hypothetical protein [Nonomuraea sp. B1E8]|uniref:hypothetical protein n=1 Tax=unclassified Nonomuraea TaxID=2593643 RepID=UPI00325DAA81